MRKLIALMALVLMAGDALSGVTVHLSADCRTFDLSAYVRLSAYLEKRRDVPVHRSEISAMDPGVFAAISNGVGKAYPLSSQA